MHRRRQPIGAAAEINRARGDQHAHPGRQAPRRAEIMLPSAGGQSCRETPGRRPHSARSTAPPISISIAAVPEAARLSATIGTKSGTGNTAIGDRAGPQLPTPHVKLIAMQPVAQRDRARHRSRRQALRDNRRLLRRAPAPPPRRSRQNLNRRKLCPSIGKLLGKPASLPRLNETGSSVRPQFPQYRSSVSLTFNEADLYFP